jgi:membrane-bound metal-dependent hydrolase YbcI (DUF457 family)
MTTPTHIMAGYLIGQWFVARNIIPSNMLNLALTVGIVAANGPDFDVIIFHKALGHRNSPFHVPWNWFKPLAAITAVSLFWNNRVFMAFTLLAQVNVFLHFMMDSITTGQGIRWLAPFSKKDFGLVFARGHIDTSIKEFVKVNLRYPVLLFDVLFWVYFFKIGRHLFHV